MSRSQKSMYLIKRSAKRIHNFYTLYIIYITFVYYIIHIFLYFLANKNKLLFLLFILIILDYKEIIIFNIIIKWLLVMKK